MYLDWSTIGTVLAVACSVASVFLHGFTLHRLKCTKTIDECLKSCSPTVLDRLTEILKLGK